MIRLVIRKKGIIVFLFIHSYFKSPREGMTSVYNFKHTEGILYRSGPIVKGGHEGYSWNVKKKGRSLLLFYSNFLSKTSYVFAHNGGIWGRASFVVKKKTRANHKI